MICSSNAWPLLDVIWCDILSLILLPAWLSWIIIKYSFFILISDCLDIVNCMPSLCFCKHRNVGYETVEHWGIFWESLTVILLHIFEHAFAFWLFCCVHDVDTCAEDEERQVFGIVFFCPLGLWESLEVEAKTWLWGYTSQQPQLCTVHWLSEWWCAPISIPAPTLPPPLSFSSLFSAFF